jgi:hypothetical protein
LKKQDLQGLRDKLEKEYAWPALYVFKFIVPSDKVEEVKALFPEHDVELKKSSKGNYQGCTAKVMANHADHVIDIYLKASTIEGIISL